MSESANLFLSNFKLINLKLSRTMAITAKTLQNPFRSAPIYSKPSKKIKSHLNTKPISISATLRVAVIGGGPAGATAAATLSAAGVQTYLLERNPSGSKPCGGAIPLCMLDEFSIPHALIDRHVTRMRIISPSNIVVDFGKTLKPHESIPMLRREVLDSFLRTRAQSHGALLISGLFTNFQIPINHKDRYIVSYTDHSSKPLGSIVGKSKTLEVDVVIGADGANSRVAKAIDAGSYEYAIAFQERIRLPDSKMEYYSDMAEMYVGDDVSPDFYGWVFPKCDHVAVGTGTVVSKANIKRYQEGIRARARSKIAGGEVIRVEAHPIPEHPRPRRVKGRVALVGDAAGYVTKCSGEGIYFAAKSGRMCAEAIVKVYKERGIVKEEDLKREYLREWDESYKGMFRFLDLLQKVYYGSNVGREALVEMCGDEYVQRMTFESYLYKKMARGVWWKDLELGMRSFGSLIRANLVGKEIGMIEKRMMML